VPVGYLIGRQLASRRAGLTLAALVAVNPMLIWYSQEARAYSLLVLLCAASLVFFLRARRTGRALDLGLWALFSALALCSHYFAAFPIAVEAVWLLTIFRRDRETLLSVAAVGAAGLLLAPLALAQANPDHISWIADSPMLLRITDTAASFMIGETGQVIAEPPRDGYAILPGLIFLAGLAVAVWPRRRPSAAVMPVLLVGCGTILLAVGVALGGSDYVIGRNLLPALVPLAAVAAAGLALMRPAWLGVVAAVTLCAYWLAFDVYVDAKPNLQRPDVRALATEIGPAHGPRVIIAWKLATDGLQYYLHDGTGHVWGGPQRVSEVDAIVKQNVAHRLGPHPPGLPASFRRVQQVREGRMTLVRYRAHRPQVILFSKLKDFKTGFGVNVVLANDGSAAPLATSPDYVGGSLKR
jgi:4-amino-4-deoxy-L-arabinose transferase-like glycosyltransferase